MTEVPHASPAKLIGVKISTRKIGLPRFKRFYLAKNEIEAVLELLKYTTYLYLQLRNVSE